MSGSAIKVSRPSSIAPIVAAVLILLVAALAHGGEVVDFSPAEEPKATQQVSIELEFGGELLATDYLAKATKQEKSDAEPSRSPLKVEAAIEYDERRLSADKSARQYRKAEATIEAAGGRRLPRLTSAHKRILANNPKTGRATLTSPAGPLTREDLDLIDIVGDARALDLLLPGEELEEGGEWTVDGEAMGRLLGLDSVAVCEVRCLVDDANKKYARFQLAGAVHGAVDSAATEIDIRAIGLYHREYKQITQINIAMTEDREVGPARPGVDGTAKIKLKRFPIDTPAELSDKALAAIDKTEADLTLHAARQGFRVPHDRRWFVAAESLHSLTLHRVEPSGLAAQTTITAQPAKSAERRPTLEDFEKEVRFSLGKAFTQLVSSEQWTSQTGCYCMGLVVEGQLDGVPLEWRYYMVMPADPSPENGASGKNLPMVSLATTVEKDMTARVGKADRDLADRLELVEAEAGARGVAALEPVEKGTVSPPRRTIRTAQQPNRRSSGIRRR